MVSTDEFTRLQNRKHNHIICVIDSLQIAFCAVLTFRQHPPAYDEYQHKKLFDDCYPCFGVDLQVVWQQVALQK